MTESIVKFHKSDTLDRIEKEAGAMLSHATTAIKIRTAEDIKPASDFLKEIKLKFKLVKCERDDLIKPVKAEIERFDAMVKKITGPLQEAEAITKQKMTDFDEAERARREEQQAKLEARAAKDEAQRKSDLESQAVDWEKKGNQDKADERREIADQTIMPTPIIPEMPTTVKSDDGSAVTFREDVEITIFDLRAFLKALPDLQIDPTRVVTVKLGAIKAFVKATGIKQIAGVNIRKTRIVAAR